MRIRAPGRPLPTPLQAPRRLGALGVALWLALASAGCAPRIQVAFEAREDFSRFRTWSWQTEDAARIDATPGAVRALAARTSSLIARTLARQGFVRDARAPDFTVAFDLSLEPRIEQVGVPSAPYFLASKDSSPSYWIEGTQVVERRVEDFQLRVEVRLRDGRVVWKGAVRERLLYAEPPPLEAAVEELLRRLPPPSQAPPPDEDPARLASR